MSGNQKPLASSSLIVLICVIGILLAVLAQTALGGTELAGVREEQAPPALPSPPPGLQAALERLGRSQKGKNGFILRSVEKGWTAGFGGAALFPQGTLRRLWLGAALLDAVTRGEISLADRPDLPARLRGQAPTVAELLQRAIAQDDTVAQDLILDGLGGPQAMTGYLQENGLVEINFGPPYAKLRVSGSRSGGASLASAPDAATAEGVASGTARLVAGQLLDAGSIEVLLAHFNSASRITVPQGWSVVRLNNDGSSAAAATVVVVRNRSGERYVVAAFCAAEQRPQQRCDAVLSSIVDALVRTSQER